MEGLCRNNRISQNPETSFALVRRYLRWMNHATPRQHITARRAGGGSARSTPRTKHGIIAPSAKVMRVARDKRPGCPQCGNAIFKPSERIWDGDWLDSLHPANRGARYISACLWKLFDLASRQNNFKTAIPRRVFIVQ